MELSWREQGIERKFIVASARDVNAARQAAAELPKPIDLIVTSPTALAREAAQTIVGDRWVYTLEEPLLAPHVGPESGDDVLARLGQALRGVRAEETNCALVVCDSLDVLGADVFVLDEKGLVGLSDALHVPMPLP